VCYNDGSSRIWASFDDPIKNNSCRVEANLVLTLQQLIFDRIVKIRADTRAAVILID
jgi:hypothetical protein